MLHVQERSDGKLTLRLGEIALRRKNSSDPKGTSLFATNANTLPGFGTTDHLVIDDQRYPAAFV